MRRLLVVCMLFFSLLAAAQPGGDLPEKIQRPKLVVGIVVDQMRWDYLYKYFDLYKPDGGFRRMMGKGFSCDNTFIPYTPTVTAVGHACVYTGSVPAINGITGNNWFDYNLNKDLYCVQDDSVSTIGNSSRAGKMSPKTLFTTTICDELKIATNFKSKVIGIAQKDRGAILPAGHAADAAYWYDPRTGDFISSSYYMEELPKWVQQFNKRKIVDSFYKYPWKPVLGEEVYKQHCTEDDAMYEYIPFQTDSRKMPYTLSSYTGKDYYKINFTPFGNNMTVEMAKAAVKAEKMGEDNITDFLAISFSSPDYIGHSFGPDSWEQLDDFVRLDETLADLLNFLDATVGIGEYTVFLTADHGVAHVPLFSKAKKLPGGSFDDAEIVDSLNSALSAKYGKTPIVKSIYNYQVVLNTTMIDTAKLPQQEIINWIIGYMEKQEAVAQVFETKQIHAAPVNRVQKEMLINGYYPSRCGQIQLVLKPGYVEGVGIGTSHGLWNPYDSHIPLLWYGWGIGQGALNREVYMTDIAPTIAALLHIQMPSGTVGKVITEVIQQHHRKP